MKMMIMGSNQNSHQKQGQWPHRHKTKPLQKNIIILMVKDGINTKTRRLTAEIIYRKQSSQSGGGRKCNPIFSNL